MESDSSSSSTSGSSVRSGANAGKIPAPGEIGTHYVPPPPVSAPPGPESIPRQVVSSETNRKRKSSSKRRRHHKRKRQNDSDLALNALAAQVSGIQQFLAQTFTVNNTVPDGNESEVSLNVSGDLYNDIDVVPSETQPCAQIKPDILGTFKIYSAF